MQEVVGDALDFRRHGGRKEQRLTGEGNQLADAFDVGNEAHVEHAVGFVDHQEFHAREQETAAFGVIEQAAGRCDQHVDAAHQFGILVAERYAADDEGDVELVVLAVLLEVLDDLRCEFARRFENERARHACPGTALFEHRDHRQGEGGGLAGSGLRDTENVAAGENVGNSLFLNGRRGLVASRFNGGDNFVGQAEIGKGHITSSRDRPTVRADIKTSCNARETVESRFAPVPGNIGSKGLKSILWQCNKWLNY